MLKNKEKILLYSSNLWSLGEGMLGPLFAVFSGRLGGSIMDITWAWAAYLIVTGFVVIVIGKLSDKHGTKEKLMVLGFALNAFFTFCYIFVSSPIELLFVQVGIGYATALATPTWQALYDKYSDSKHDGFIWGLASGQGYIATGIAMVVGGMIVSCYSFTALFVTMGIIQTIATIYQAKILIRQKE